VTPSSDARLRAVRVLVVDDGPDSLEIVAAYLRYRGALVDTAANASEAVRCVAAVRPDVLIIDYTMPAMTGVQLLERIRQMPSQAERPTPAILYTAFHDLREVALAAGFSAYLKKPLDPGKLLDEVARLAGV
jgi:CheY-like chemotaxis protein